MVNSLAIFNFGDNSNILLSSGHKIHSQLSALIILAEAFGLPVADIIASREYLQYNEYQLCLDQIITQVYEYEIQIDSNFYNAVKGIAESLALQPDSYRYLAELISR